MRTEMQLDIVPDGYWSDGGTGLEVGVEWASG